MKKNIRTISCLVPNNYNFVENKKAKAVIELREINQDAQEMYAQERVRRGFDSFESWLK